MAHIRASASQREFAEELGVPLRTYQNYEQDKREPDLRTLIGLHERGWNLNWVLAGSGSERLEALGYKALHAREEADLRVREEGPLYQSQAARSQDIKLAVQLTEEALDGGRLEPADYATLVSLIHDALVNGLPSAQVLAFARPAARGIRGQDDGTDVGGSGAATAR